MKRPSLGSLAKWGVGPLVVLTLAGVGAQGFARRNAFFSATSSLSPAEQARLEAAPVLAAGNVTWALGSADSVKKMLHLELDRVPEADGKTRSRVLLRFGIIDPNPEGQAAVFAQACAADASICNDLQAAALREVQERYASPGNTLPVFFVPNHPPIGL